MAVQEKRHVSYADAGVDVGEGARAVDAIKDAVRATARPEVIGGLGGFGSCFSMRGFKDMEDPILVSSTDGVGTKLAIARLLDRHETVGQDLVAMCVDDIVPLGAEPLFFLDYVAVGKLRADHMAKVVSGIAKGCRLSGCALVERLPAVAPGETRDEAAPPNQLPRAADDEDHDADPAPEHPGVPARKTHHAPWERTITTSLPRKSEQTPAE